MKDIMDEDKRLEEELKELRQVPIDENDRKRKRAAEAAKTAKRRGFPFAAVFMALVVGVLAGLGGGYYVWGWERPYTVDLKAVEVPDWVKQEFIRKKYFSRPDVSRRKINNIVLHYVANPVPVQRATEIILTAWRIRTARKVAPLPAAILLWAWKER